ncbi:hypothetical protein MFUL124B02_00065 [Myxococcus fulvus 124B02]|nr:hypothetical protein MFUL124B02_00065 [Myxococcus fulvus 124B02]
MPARFFELNENVQGGNWYLGDIEKAPGQEVDDPWMFRAGRPIQVQGPLSAPINEPGKALDFCLAGVGLAPILHVKLATLFMEMAPDDVQTFPVSIKGQPDQYVILVARKLFRCIDEQASKVQFWDAEFAPPGREGTYYAVDDMRIDTSKVGNAKVFRVEGWDIPLIISADIKEALERLKPTGAKFVPV